MLVLIIQFITDLSLVNEQFEDKSSKTKPLPKSRVELVFACGQTNPLLCINEFEKCCDVKTDKDKMFKIRNFVNDSHRGKD